jgi:hypothetical protein
MHVTDPVRKSAVAHAADEFVFEKCGNAATISRDTFVNAVAELIELGDQAAASPFAKAARGEDLSIRRVLQLATAEMQKRKTAIEAAALAPIAKKVQELQESAAELVDASHLMKARYETLRNSPAVPMPLRSAHLVPEELRRQGPMSEIEAFEAALAGTTDPAARVALTQRLELAKAGR